MIVLIGNFISAAIQGASQIGGAIVSGAFGLAQQKREQQYTQENMDKAHQQNEESADAADARKRAFYTDFESPEATMRQLKEAGLSPGLFYGGSGAGGMGASGGAQGGGMSAPAGAPYRGTDPGEYVQGLGMALADIKLKNAEANNLEADTNIKKGKGPVGESNLALQSSEIQKNLKEAHLKEAETAYQNAQVRYVDAMTTAQEFTNDLTEDAREDILNRYKWEWKKLNADYEKSMAETNEKKETLDLIKQEYKARYREIVSKVAMNLSQEKVNAKEVERLAQTILTLQAQTENEKKKPEWFEKELETRLEQTKQMKTAMIICAGMGLAGNIVKGVTDIFAPVKGIGKAVGNIFGDQFGRAENTTGHYMAD